jgi:DedD protein
MAERKEAEDDFNPRHRIVGAVVLVALAVIFLPMLLSDRPSETDESRVAPGGSVPETRIVVTPVPLPGDKATSIPKLAAPEKAPEKASTVAKTVVVPVEPTSEVPAVVNAPAIPESRQPEAKPVPEPKPVSESRKSTVTAKPAASVEKGWLVQVGAFSQLDNARRLHERLSQKGYAAMLDPPNPEKGKTVRVEVGPYKDAAAAKAAQARIQSEFGIKGVVRKQ